MPYYFFQWNDYLIDHMEHHGVSVEDFEVIVMGARKFAESRSTHRTIAFGWTSDDRYVACVFEWIDEDTILPCTACEVEE